MAKRIYLHFLILCGIMCQGIIATSGEDTRESSDFLVRKRRVISNLPDGQTLTPIYQAKYMVNIEHDNRAHCIGVILSHYTVITADTCFNEHDLPHYKVLSGAPYDTRSNIHNITSKAVYYGNPPYQIIDGIALITVDPPFEFSRTTGYINLHVGPLPVGTLVTVRGWGCGHSLRPATPGVQRRLRSITLPIMNHRECENEYRGYHRITEKHICTYDAQQYCATTDVGAPIVFNNRLAGIHVWKGEHTGRRNPDVYIDLQRAEYSKWIRENTLLM